MIYAFTTIWMDGWMDGWMDAPHFYPKFHPSHCPCHIQYNFFFLVFNGESLEDPSLELQMSKHPSTLGICTCLLWERARYEGITPTLTFSTYLPTYLARTPTYSPRYYQGSVRFWHPLEAQTPTTIIALYPIQHPCWCRVEQKLSNPLYN